MTTVPSNSHRIAAWFRSLVFLVASAVFLGAMNDLFMQPELRARIDATKSRAYSLSPRSVQLLETLDGEWSITLVMVESETDMAVLRQIDEVLQRYEETAPSLAVRRIDPSNPAALTAYEQLLLDLRDREVDSIKEYEATVNEGVETFQNLIVFAGPASGWLDELVSSLAPDSEHAQDLSAISAALRLLGQRGNLVLDKVGESLEQEPGDPLPDLDAARAILYQGLSQWARELQSASRRLDRFMESGQTYPGTTRPSALVSRRLAEEAAGLAVVADRLQRLEPLQISTIARQLREGEAAIIVGPDRVMAIPASQLFATNLQKDDSGSVRIDQRFRGEQLISSAIRSMHRDTMPTVVFVHGEEQSRLEPDPRQADVTGIAMLLEAARIDVVEWAVNLGPQPAFPPGAQVVWVILPPSQRKGFEITSGEKRLLESTAFLIEQGEPVLISLYPSFLPRYGQPDPWAQIVVGLGIEAATGTVLLEETINPDGDVDVQMFQQLIEFPSDHPVARALNGQRLALPLPIPLRVVAGGDGGEVQTLASIDPGPARWLETEWTPSLDLGPVSRDGKSMQDPMNVLLALEREPAEGEQSQRLLVVGSGPWMLTNVADVAITGGGNRISLLNPGNHELMMASVAWLAGDDELVAQGPLSQEVARLRGIGAAQQQLYRWLLLLGLPGCVLLAGFGVWMARRS